jgi:hypothetical protein
MEYNQQLIQALTEISVPLNLMGDPNGMRGLLEDKLDEAKHHILDLNISGLQDDIVITRGELGYLNKIEHAYSLFMETYREYLDNQSITNNY